MKITKIEDLNNIPEGITELYISDLGLTILPKLAQSLTGLYCWDNELTSLDNLPSDLTYLNCYSNKLTSLDIAHCIKLERLHCINNNFIEEIQVIINNNDLTTQDKIIKLIDGCLIPYDNSFVLK